jgi:hypothetical protein
MFESDDKTQRYEVSGSVSYDRRRQGSPGDDFMERLERARTPALKTSLLDSNLANYLHAKLLGSYTRELDRQAENRLDMAMDEDFYDHIQFTEEEIAILAARGQAPIVFNMIQTTVNWVLGSQRRAPMDYRILPRKKAGLESAERKTQLLKHVSDTNRSEYEWSTAFAKAVKTGLGWVETGQGRPEDGNIVYVREEDWRSMLWDSTARRYDLQDARYEFRTKWLDVDIAANLWPHRQGIIAAAAQNATSGLYDLDNMGDEPMDSQEVAHFQDVGPSSRGNQNFATERERVRVVEGWFKRPIPNAQIIRGGQFNGELFDEWSQGHINDLYSGVSTLVTRPREVIHVALFTDAGLLDLRRSPYRHNRFPFTPLWGYRRARDGMPYGMIRGLRDIQRDLNKRASKALHHLSTTRVLVEDSAVDDIEVLRDEAARPDAVIVYKAGRAAPQVHSDTGLAAAHVDLMNRDAQMIQQVGGVTDENMGRKTNATSGKAIIARQDQGQLATSMFFDNLRQSRLIHGEKELVMVEQFYTDEDVFRVTDARGNPDYVAINDGDPRNAISDHKADFIISEEDWRATARQAQAEQLLDLAGKLAATAPQLVLNILDLVVEALDVPKRDELVKRIRQLTGQADPDADPNNPDPETLAMQEQKAKESALAERQAMAAIEEAEGKARKINAEAMKATASIPADAIATMKAAFEAALAIAGAPAVSAAADQILSDAMAAAGMLGQQPAAAQPQPQPAM